jgi:hypothetical protein
MLSTQYRIRLEEIAGRISRGETVELNDIIWAEKLAKANRSAASILRKARREALNPNMHEDGLDAFMNAMDLGNPDPSTHLDSSHSIDDIVDFFHNDERPD